MTLKNSIPSAGVVVIGAEVLSGKVDDENSPFLIRALRTRGVHLGELRVIDDDPMTIAETVREMAKRFDHVITTGGIGPTHDDLTVEGIAGAFEVDVVIDPTLEALLTQHYGDRLTDAHRKLAEIPAGATVLIDEGFPVPVVRCENVFVLPGVPELMRRCFHALTPLLGGGSFFTAGLLISEGETRIAGALRNVQKAHRLVSIGSYPRYDEPTYRVKVTVDGTDRGEVEDAMTALRGALEPGWIVGEL